jgi:predicted metal-dependent enzyme (double-stranded beta helix superfamily)
MTYQDLLIKDNGQWERYETPASDDSSPYRLYRFLTDLENILASIQDTEKILQGIRPLVRRLLTQSFWLQWQYLDPEPETGWSVSMLYDEPGFPLTIQNVTWSPGTVSPIHNHGTWGVVAILGGQEKNTFWRPHSTGSSRLEKAGEVILNPGDMIMFSPDTIHSVEVVGNEPVISFNLYGVTDYQTRFEFDLTTETKANF